MSVPARIAKIANDLAHSADNGAQIVAALMKSSKLMCVATNNYTSHAETNAMKPRQYLKEP